MALFWRSERNLNWNRGKTQPWKEIKLSAGEPGNTRTCTNQELTSICPQRRVIINANTWKIQDTESETDGRWCSIIYLYFLSKNLLLKYRVSCILIRSLTEIKKTALKIKKKSHFGLSHYIFPSTFRRFTELGVVNAWLIRKCSIF